MAVMRLLNTFKSQDHVRAAQQSVSCMDYQINLLLKAGQLRSDTVKSFKTKLLIWDSGAPFGLISFHADFIDYLKCEIGGQDISKLNKVVGFGTTLHKFNASNVMIHYVHALSYNLPSKDNQLCSP